MCSEDRTASLRAAGSRRTRPASGIESGDTSWARHDMHLHDLAQATEELVVVQGGSKRRVNDHSLGRIHRPEQVLVRSELDRRLRADAAIRLPKQRRRWHEDPADCRGRAPRPGNPSRPEPRRHRSRRRRESPSWRQLGIARIAQRRDAVQRLGVLRGGMSMAERDASGAREPLVRAPARRARRRRRMRSPTSANSATQVDVIAEVDRVIPHPRTDRELDPSHPSDDREASVANHDLSGHERIPRRGEERDQLRRSLLVQPCVAAGRSARSPRSLRSCCSASSSRSARNQGQRSSRGRHRRPNSTAIARVSPLSPVFATVYGSRRSFATMAQTDEMLTTRPQPRWAIAGAKARARRSGATRSTSSISCSRSSSVSSSRASRLIPATLTRMSIG